MHHITFTSITSCRFHTLYITSSQRFKMYDACFASVNSQRMYKLKQRVLEKLHKWIKDFANVGGQIYSAEAYRLLNERFAKDFVAMYLKVS